VRRWRLILGGEVADYANAGMSEADRAIDKALKALYNWETDSGVIEGRAGQRGGLGSSAPSVARWLGDIRTYFPSSVVRVMQQDALERLNLRQMLLEPEMLRAVEPDVHLVATLIALKSVIPNKTKDTARLVVRRVVEDLEQRLANPMRQAVAGALNRAIRNRRPRHNEIDWNRTIRLNLKHYQPAYRTIIPETRVGYGRRRSSLRDIILCIDQSGSMASSVVYASVFGAVLASLQTVKTHMIVYDTSVVDLTDELNDPVDLLFGAQLGGGNDGDRALAYCEKLIERPQETIFILISDLYEGPNIPPMLKRIARMVSAGVQFIALLALDDAGTPSYDKQFAASLADLNVPAFACTPDLFPELMAAAINRDDIRSWAAARDIVTNRGQAG